MLLPPYQNKFYLICGQAEQRIILPSKSSSCLAKSYGMINGVACDGGGAARSPQHLGRISKQNRREAKYKRCRGYIRLSYVVNNAEPRIHQAAAWRGGRGGWSSATAIMSPKATSQLKCRIASWRAAEEKSIEKWRRAAQHQA